MTTFSASAKVTALETDRQDNRNDPCNSEEQREFINHVRHPVIIWPDGQEISRRRSTHRCLSH